MNDISDGVETDFPPITELSKVQRRVLGVLIEKAYTTPEYYPLTLKAVTTGCNQKSNRSPVVNHSEEAVFDVLDELRQQGLVAVVHTESGRTERFRHYMRKQFSFSEPQLAVITELLLRGRQTLGELRSRTSRMVPIENLAQLREELQGLMQLGYVQASGSLERRGIEVDHNLYQPGEGQILKSNIEDENKPPRTARSEGPQPTGSTNATTLIVDQAETTTAASPNMIERVSLLELASEEMRNENRELRDELDVLKREMQELSSRFDDLRHDLGG